VDGLPSFSEYVDARWSRLVRTVIMLGAERHAAEDVVQSALARCCFRWSKIVAGGEPDAYVYRALVNELNSTRRRFWRREVPTDHLPVSDSRVRADDATEDVDARTLVGEALARLSAGQRQVLVLRFFADLTETQVGDLLGVPVGTVKSRASRGLSTLSADPQLIALLEGPTP
jgi:RNA polymerase sigma-70 factor (sigma-E family)